MKPPHIAILLPCYNVEEYIAEALISAFNQSYTGYGKLTIFTLDDQSSDGTNDLIKNGARSELLDPDYVYCGRNEQNLGWCGSYNKLAKIAIEHGCDALMIMGADDTIHPLCVGAMERFMREIDSDFVIVTGQMMGGGQLMQSTPDATLEDFRNGNAIANFALIKSQMWLELQGYDTNFRYADWEFWIRAVKSGKKYGIVNQPFYNYRLHENNDHKKADHHAEHQKILQKHFNF